MRKIKHLIRMVRTILYSFFKQKKFYYKNKTVKYIFKKGTTNRLLVIFPAVSKKPNFNYITTLKKSQHNVVFLKDTFGKPGSYFLGQSFNFNIFELIDELINKCCKNKKLILTMVGSSKGGSSALFYALMSKHNIDSLIIGSPQYSLGDYFYNHGGKSYLINICGDDSFSSAKKLDEFCHNLVLKSKKKMNIYLYSSTFEDNFHLKDIYRLTSDLKQTNNTMFFFDGKFRGHEGLAESFRNFLKKIQAQL